LQIIEKASLEVIKGAYRHLSQKWHPDKNPNQQEESERIMRMVNEAYAVLSDPVQRRKHDAWIKEQRAKQRDTSNSQSESTAKEQADNLGADPYEIAYDEILNSSYQKGLWIKAFADSEADENKQKALYIKYRVQQLKTPTGIFRNVVDKVKQNQEDLRKQKERRKQEERNKQKKKEDLNKREKQWKQNERRKQREIEGYIKAAESGDTEAQNNLGVIYETGRGVTKDLIKAVQWYRKGAKQGNDTAQYNLGVMYENGEGIPQDYKKAVEWYSKAAKQGNSDAQGMLRELEERKKQEREWINAAEQGDATAQNNLGVMYETGRGGNKDLGEAAWWYRKAAEQGDADAQENLARIKTKERN
jgi:TPR repeat protein